MSKELTDEEVKELISQNAVALAVELSAFVASRPLAGSELGSLVAALGIVYLAEIKCKEIAGLGSDGLAAEFQRMMRRPLERSVDMLRGRPN